MAPGTAAKPRVVEFAACAALARFPAAHIPTPAPSANVTTITATLRIGLSHKTRSPQTCRFAPLASDGDDPAKAGSGFAKLEIDLHVELHVSRGRDRARRQ